MIERNAKGFRKLKKLSKTLYNCELIGDKVKEGTVDEFQTAALAFNKYKPNIPGKISSEISGKYLKIVQLPDMFCKEKFTWYMNITGYVSTMTTKQTITGSLIDHRLDIDTNYQIEVQWLYDDRRLVITVINKEKFMKMLNKSLAKLNLKD